MNPDSQSGAAAYAQTTNVVAQFTNQIQVFNTSVSYFKKINISNNNNTGNDNDSDNAGAHQLEPLSPLISWVNPFPSSFIFRTAFFPQKESRSTDESDLTDGQRRKSARSWGNVT